jgi:hypothetical protein
LGEASFDDYFRNESFMKIVRERFGEIKTVKRLRLLSCEQCGEVRRGTCPGHGHFGRRAIECLYAKANTQAPRPTRKSRSQELSAFRQADDVVERLGVRAHEILANNDYPDLDSDEIGQAIDPSEIFSADPDEVFVYWPPKDPADDTLFRLYRNMVQRDDISPAEYEELWPGWTEMQAEIETAEAQRQAILATVSEGVTVPEHL